MKVFSMPSARKVWVTLSAPCHSLPIAPPPIRRSSKLAVKLPLKPSVSVSNLVVSTSGWPSITLRYSSISIGIFIVLMPAKAISGSMATSSSPPAWRIKMLTMPGKRSARAASSFSSSLIDGGGGGTSTSTNFASRAVAEVSACTTRWADIAFSSSSPGSPAWNIKVLVKGVPGANATP